MSIVFIEPQLASSVDQPPEGKHWIHEIKRAGLNYARASGLKINIARAASRHYAKQLNPLSGAI